MTAALDPPLDPSLVAEVRTAVPGIALENLVVIPGALLVAFAVTQVATRLAAPSLEAGEPWWERTRKMVGARAAALVTAFAALGIGCVSTSRHFTGPFALVPGHVLVPAVVLATLVGAAPALLWADRRATGAAITLREWLAGWVVLSLLTNGSFAIAGLSVVSAAAGLPLVHAGLLGTLVVLFANVRILRVAGLLRPSPRLAEIVTRVATRKNLPHLPAAYEVHAWWLNAFALLGKNAVVFTTGAMQHLADDEIEAVVAHEVGHLLEPRRIYGMRVVTSLAGPMALVGAFQMFAPVHGVSKKWGLVAIGVALVLRFAHVRLGRRLEKRADGHAHDDPAFGRALLRLTERNGQPLVGSAPGVHGHPYDRIAAAGVELPARPAPPPRRRTGLGTFIAFGVLLSIVFLGESLTRIEDDGSREELESAAALTGGADDTLSQLAFERAAQGDRSALVLMMGAARADGRSSIHHVLNVAMVYARLGECELARTLVEHQETSLKRHDEERRHYGAAEADVERCVPVPR